jgi:hypothetical protein
MQFFINGLDGSQSVVSIQENETLSTFVLNNNLNGLRLVCQGSILTE